MLFQPERHEALSAPPWDAREARDAILRIATEVERAYSAESFWPDHPQDDDWRPEQPMLSLFWGASGTLWALRDLAERGYLPFSPRGDFAAFYARYLKEPDTDGKTAPGYLFGESGILTVAERFAPSEAGRAALLRSLGQTIDRKDNEIMWGSPGAIVAASLLYGRSGDAEYLSVLRRAATRLMEAWITVEESTGARLWTQDWGGTTTARLYGAVHGYAGNVFALLRALPHLGAASRESILKQAEATLARTALHEGELANWAPSATDPKRLVQWCHGAPGMITSYADFPVNASNDLEALLKAGGELTWRAGPLRKAFGLCHGTAGNGYAFLTLYARTGDALWLERARAFAMHALAQSDREAQLLGRRRFGLYTGDLGLLEFLASCLESDSRWPTLERC